MSQPIPYFTCLTLAALGEGLPSYANEAKNKDTGIKNVVQKEGRCCGSVTLAFSLLAIVFAGGGAVLLAFSGGPNNLALFVPGAAFGGTSVAFSLGLVAVIAQAIRFRKACKAQLLDYAAKRIDDSVVLQEMQEADLEQIKHVFRAAPPELREHFLKFVHAEFFEKNKLPLDEKQEKVLAALASNPDAFLSLDPTTLNRQFILYLAKYVDSERFIQGDNEEIALRFLQQIGRPQDKAEASILARHPKILVNWCFKDQEPSVPENLASGLIAEIVSHMEDAQAAEFLKASRAILNDKSISTERRWQVSEVVNCCLAGVFDRAFFEKFLGRLDLPNEEAAEGEIEQEELSKRRGAMALLNALSVYPQQLADHVCKNNLLVNNPFADALHKTFHPRDYGVFLKFAANTLDEAKSKCEKVKDKGKERSSLLSGLISTRSELPELTLDILSKYFASDPENFAPYLSNPSLKENADLALRILGNMSEDSAASVICLLDNRSSVKRFNLLAGTLIKNLNSSIQMGVTDDQAKLIALFKYAPQASSKKSIFHPDNEFFQKSYSFNLKMLESIAQPYQQKVKEAYAKLSS